MTKAPLQLVPPINPEQLTELTDDDLVLLIKKDYQAAFEELVNRHQTLVLGFSVRYLNDSSLGRDVAQDVFLSIWAQRQKYQARGQFRAYLLKVTVNRCRYFARQRQYQKKKHHAVQQESRAEVESGQLPLAQVLETEKTRIIRAKLTLLPEKTRNIIILRYVNDLSLEEISTIAQMPLGTVKSHIFRGIERLSRLWKKEAP